MKLKNIALFAGLLIAQVSLAQVDETGTVTGTTSTTTIVTPVLDNISSEAELKAQKEQLKAEQKLQKEQEKAIKAEEKAAKAKSSKSCGEHIMTVCAIPL